MNGLFMTMQSKLLVVGITVFLSACSAKSSVSTSGSKAQQDYIAKKSELYTNGVTVPSTSNPCVDQFTFLKGTSIDEYNNYSRSYTKLGDGFRFLNVNKKIMNPDAKEVYTMKLEVKLDTLCSKLEYSGYQVVKERIKIIADI